MKRLFEAFILSAINKQDFLIKLFIAAVKVTFRPCKATSKTTTTNFFPKTCKKI